MDINAYPPNNAQLSMRALHKFRMPTNSGGKLVFALTKKYADVVVPLYTLIITFTFIVGLELVVLVVVGFSKRVLKRDIEKDLAIWKFGSLNTARFMLKALARLLLCPRKGSIGVGREEPPQEKPAPPQGQQAAASRDEQPQLMGKNNFDREEDAGGVRLGPRLGTRLLDQREVPSTRDLCLCGAFAVLSSILFIGELAMGIVVSQKLVVGNVAPVNPDQVFYPDIDNLIKQNNGPGLARLASLKMHSALRAIAASEGPGIIARRRVIIEKVGLDGGQTENLPASLNYAYNVTGVDMGLQSDPKLMLRVKGSCHTDYTWLVNSTGEGDTYRLWGGNSTHLIKRGARSELPPSLAFFLDEKGILERSRNLSYAIVADTAGRYSYTPGQDPWYSTERAPTNSTPPYQVRSGRPALRCWETKSWHLNGKDVDNWRLNTLPGLKLHKLWAQTVFPYEFQRPGPVSLGQAVGISALKLASYALDPPHYLEAGAASIYADFERLVLGSWIRSGNVLSDTTRYDHRGMVNIAQGQGGLVDASAAKFVLESKDVTTMSIQVMIAVPAVWFLIILVKKLSEIWCTKRRD
ncbi:hypothetical protein HOY82DRAFT_601186 [Tuber indicum]|nr:hypothetical protein HOY82DRAFT_601186 [Tuber indicum]